MKYNRKYSITMLLFFLVIFNIWAKQKTGQKSENRLNNSQTLIKGKVVDGENEKPLEYATVSLFNQHDSTLVTGGITDQKGIFKIPAKTGKYMINIQFISYKTITRKDIVIDQEQPVKDLGKIIIYPDAETLSEVEVRAEKSQLELALDKKIFNVGKDLANTGGSAADILDNIPSVTVDIDGNVSLRGSQNVRILVDGKLSGLVGISGTSALRQLQANLIDKIEVITNPSARYDAEGMSGIINIVLKKESQKGMNGSFDVSVGHPENYGLATNVNFRREKINLFANYGLRYQKNPGRGSAYQEFYLPDSVYFTERNRKHERGGWSNNIRLGADFYLNKYNTITTSFLYRISKEDNISNIAYKDLDSQKQLTQTVFRTENEFEKEPNQEYAVNYRKEFTKEGHLLTAELQYRESSESQNADYDEKTLDASNTETGVPLRQRSSNKEGENNLLVQLDYIYPFAKDGKIEVGYKSTFREIDNDYLIEELGENTQWTTLASLTNHFIYNEDIYAVYGIIGNKIKNFSYQLGLRFEYSDVITELQETREINDRSYKNFFPSTHFTYEFNNKNSIQWSYSRRLRRPRFWDLNPFFTFSDSRNIRSGNPNLDPELTDSFEINYLKDWTSTSISAGIYYRYTDGEIQRISTVDDTGITISKPVNLSNQNSYGFEFIFSSDLYQWWKLNSSFNFFRAITDGGYLGEKYQRDTYSWTARVNSRITLWDKADFQTMFNYRAPQETTQGRSKGVFSMDMGLSKDVLKNKGTLTLNIRDILNSRKRVSETKGENFYAENEFQWRSRQIILGFNYRINQKKKRERNKSGNFEEGDFDF